MRLSFPVYRSLAQLGLVGELPTTALYLLNPLSKALPEMAAEIQYCGGNIYRIGSNHVVVRTTNKSGLARLRKAQGRIIYIVDDHFASGAADGSLPDYYRERLGRFLDQQHQAIIDCVTDVVVPSRALGETYHQLTGGKPIHVIDPVYSCHAAQICQSGESVMIGLLSSRSHLADLKSIGPALCAVMDGHSNVGIVHRLGDADLGLPTGPNVQRLKPLSWQRYRKWKPEIQIGLYPLLDSEFNRYRSINKLIEYVFHGAAPLVSDVPAMQEVPEQLRVGSDDWPARIDELVRNLEMRRDCWECAAAFVSARNPLGTASKVWSSLLRP